tara:strand:- start:343 stop:1302 length:960 start_codon:yes stop_codon:yes gene_type:complete
MKKKIEIFCTLGPKSLNKFFLKYVDKKVNLLRLNMSHIEPKNLERLIRYVKKFTKVPICIDTEGAQIRTRVRIKKNYKINKLVYIIKENKNFNIYPPEVFQFLKKNDQLHVGFDGLKIKVIKHYKNKIKCKVTNPGILDNNKGVHLINRKITLNYLTKKDETAIKIALKNKIKNFALSFTNNAQDIHKFNKLLPGCRKIFKLETMRAIKNLNSIMSSGKDFLIDRGDLSKETTIEKIPFYQKLILKKANIKKVNVFVATNFLESMMKNPYPTRGEANDIYTTLVDGAKGLVLAGETAVGKYPRECVQFLGKIIKVFKSH